MIFVCSSTGPYPSETSLYGRLRAAWPAFWARRGLWTKYWSVHVFGLYITWSLPIKPWAI